MPPAIVAAVGAISAVAGIASTVQGLSAQAANKKDIKARNKAASTANVLVGKINKNLRSEVKGINKVLSNSVSKQNNIIDSSNSEIRELNNQARDFISSANNNIDIANEARTAQVGSQQVVERLNAGRSRRQAIREKIILQGRADNIAGLSGGLDSSLAQGGASSLESQLGETLGFSSQITSINQQIGELSLIESISQGLAANSQASAQQSQIDAVQIQREAEASLRIQQNKQSVAVNRAQNRIQLLQNKASRIKEQASLDPNKFNKQNRTTQEIKQEKINKQKTVDAKEQLANDFVGRGL